MLRRDLIMVQIEELGKVIAQIVSQRNTDAARKNPELIQTVYNSLKVDRDLLLTSSPEELLGQLNQEDNCGLQRMELAAKTLLEETYLCQSKQLQNDTLLKVTELLEYIQMRDTTFSLERIALLDTIKSLYRD